MVFIISAQQMHFWANVIKSTKCAVHTVSKLKDEGYENRVLRKFFWAEEGRGNRVLEKTT
jgi:hypothetical protein